jgi:hypothetical protein
MSILSFQNYIYTDGSHATDLHRCGTKTWQGDAFLPPKRILAATNLCKRSTDWCHLQSPTTVTWIKNSLGSGILVGRNKTVRVHNECQGLLYNSKPSKVCNEVCIVCSDYLFNFSTVLLWKGPLWFCFKYCYIIIWFSGFFQKRINMLIKK